MVGEKGFPCLTSTIHPGSGAYVHHVIMGCTSSLDTVWVFKENFIFSPLSAYSPTPTPKATRNTLKLSILVCNLHAA